MVLGVKERASTGVPAVVSPAKGGVAAWLSRVFVPAGLSARLLALTVIFVLVSEVFIYVPSIATYRLNLLSQRLETAQIAALALEANGGEEVGSGLAQELLANAGVSSVSLKRYDQRLLFLAPGQIPPRPEEVLGDVAQTGFFKGITDAFALLWRTQDRFISISGVPRLEGGLSIEAVLHEQPIRTAMLHYSENMLKVSLALSALTAILVYLAISRLLVRPIKRIERSMADFRLQPEIAHPLHAASKRRDEIGMAERELLQMQGDLRSALRQRARLAALGTAVSKINHDLRNMLSSAQLIVDRLQGSEDPQVKRLAPKLVSAIDRAVALASNTLRYGRAEEMPPHPRAIDLPRLVEDVGSSAIGRADSAVRFKNEVPEAFELFADPDQMFRILLNLARNAVQAIEHAGGGGEVSVTARAETGFAVLEVRDTGPGIPEKARAHLFEPFATSSRADGTGLGLAIASELVTAHGGTIELASTGPEGTVFRIRLPQPA